MTLSIILNSLAIIILAVGVVFLTFKIKKLENMIYHLYYFDELL